MLNVSVLFKLYNMVTPTLLYNPSIWAPNLSMDMWTRIERNRAFASHDVAIGDTYQSIHPTQDHLCWNDNIPNMVEALFQTMNLFNHIWSWFFTNDVVIQQQWTQFLRTFHPSIVYTSWKWWKEKGIMARPIILGYPIYTWLTRREPHLPKTSLLQR